MLDLTNVSGLGNLTGRSQVWVALLFVSDDNGTSFPEGAYVDDIVLRKYVPPAVGSGAAGQRHTCFVTPGGAAKCWGGNFLGQLGDGSTTDRFTPTDVMGLGSGVAAMAAGHYHTCALTTSGGVKCWGWNGRGQLGDGTTTSRLTPVDVLGLGGGPASITAGWEHVCAFFAGGGAKCWGNNYDGQLGDGTKTDRLTPVDVVGMPGVVPH